METTANILVGEEDAAVRGFLWELLQEEGYNVVTADSAPLAREHLTRQIFALALIDLKMNGDSGLSVLSELQERAPDTTAIVLTGYGSLETAVEALRCGAHDYLLKPCKPDRLRASVRSGLEAYHARQQQRAGAKFVADISHELRNPLTTINLGLKLLEHATPDKHPNYIANLKKAAGQLEELVQNTLLLSRLDAGQDQSRRTHEDLNTLAAEVVSTQQCRAEEHTITLHFTPDTQARLVHGVRSQLIQVLSNLITNAIHYTLAGGTITARVAAMTGPQGQAGHGFEIQDTGIGIPAEDLPHLFTRFYRGRDTSRLRVPGNGLGLAIAKEIVELHSGAITVESEVGVGSTFRVWLPVTDEDEVGSDDVPKPGNQ